MKKLSSLFLLIVLTVIGYSQSFTLAPVSDHYKDLQRINGQPNPSRSWMDTLTYPPSEFSSSIVYLLVKPHYLTDGEVKIISESIQFPANSSDQVRKELDYLLDLQGKRTPEQVTRVKVLGDIGYWPPINMMPSHPGYKQNLLDLFFEGKEIIGESVNATNFPKLSTLLQGVMQDMRVMEYTIKYKQLRARPYHLEPSLKPLARMTSPSYASGHSLWAFLQAFTWSEVIPERQKDFIALAEEIRRSREIMGIHYPSDDEAARQIAYKMLQSYFKKESFKKDLGDAVNEWKLKSAEVGAN